MEFSGILRYFSILGSFLCMTLMLWTVRYVKQNFRARLYFFLTFFAFIYVFGYAQSLVQISNAGVIFWSRFQFLGIAFLPFCLVVFSYHSIFSNESKVLSRWVYLFLLPGLAIVLTQWSYPHTQLYYLERVITLVNGFLRIHRIQPGFFWRLNLMQIITGLFLSLFFLLRSIRKHSGSFKKDRIFIFAGIVIIALVYLIYVFLDRHRQYEDPMPIVISLVSPLFAAGVFSNRLIGDLANAHLAFYRTSLHPVFVFNKEHKLLDMNPAAKNLFGINTACFHNCSWLDLLEKLEVSQVQTLQKNGEVQKEFEWHGQVYEYMSTIFHDKYGSERGVFRTVFDVTEQRAALAVLEQEASQDTLTGLLTRRRWERAAMNSLKLGLRFKHAGSMLMLDLDHFKKLNDEHGHQAGDEVLKIVSARLQQKLREVDIVGRYGGEEFCIWLPETSPENAVFAAEKVRMALAAKPVEYGNVKLFITCSIGVYGQDVIDNADLHSYIKNADFMLYKAKDEGRNCVVGFHSP